MPGGEESESGSGSSATTGAQQDLANKGAYDLARAAMLRLVERIAPDYAD